MIPLFEEKKKRERLFLTAGQVDKAVRTLYEKQGCVVLSGVRNGTGFERSARTADMMAVSTWPSRGFSCAPYFVTSQKLTSREAKLKR